jgi:uncharacterized protein YndB with AHSA1/START domain
MNLTIPPWGMRISVGINGHQSLDNFSFTSQALRGEQTRQASHATERLHILSARFKFIKVQVRRKLMKEQIMQDTIEREITVKASKERVYQAISDPKQIVTWFPDAIEGSLEAGERPILVFGEQDHRTQIYVEAARPHEYFAYRWVPGRKGTLGDVLKVPNTLVEFRIEELGEGTKVFLKESGFASLPAEVAENSLQDNSHGWSVMMERLEKAMSEV